MADPKISEMIERVAEAVFDSACASLHRRGLRASEKPYAEQSEGVKDNTRAHARAAVEAMRSPPGHVLDALNQMAQCEGYIEEGWNAAIDAMLGE